MLIIPIGTKSALSLTPKVTIGLIITCTIVFVLSSMPAGNIQSDLFDVHRGLYASQVKLYLLEKAEMEGKPGYIDPYARTAIEQIRNSSDYIELQAGIIAAMGNSPSCFSDLESFGRDLRSRDESWYAGKSEQSDAYAEWARLKNSEDKVLSRHVNYAFGLVPARMGRFWTFITYMFLHGSLMHLFGNMLFLWIVGCLLEDSWGRLPFLGFYLAGGVLAGWAHCLQDTSSTVPLIGASGAIAAAMGAFTVRHFMTKIKFFYFFLLLIRPVWGTFYLPAFVFLPLWFIEQVALRWLTGSAGGAGVAYLSHITGYIFGVVTALAIKGFGLEERWIAPMVRRKQIDEGVRKDPRFGEACDMMSGGQIERAAHIFDQLAAERPDDLQLLSDISMVYMGAGYQEKASNLANTVLKAYMLKARGPEAAGVVLSAIVSKQPWHLDPNLMLRVGKWLGDEGRDGESNDVYRHILSSGASPGLLAKTSMALARLLSTRFDNTRDALDVLDQAMALDVDQALKGSISELRDSLAGASSITAF